MIVDQTFHLSPRIHNPMFCRWTLNQCSLNFMSNHITVRDGRDSGEKGEAIKGRFMLCRLHCHNEDPLQLPWLYRSDSHSHVIRLKMRLNDSSVMTKSSAKPCVTVQQEKHTTYNHDQCNNHPSRQSNYILEFFKTISYGHYTPLQNIQVLQSLRINSEWLILKKKDTTN